MPGPSARTVSSETRRRPYLVLTIFLRLTHPTQEHLVSSGPDVIQVLLGTDFADGTGTLTFYQSKCTGLEWPYSLAMLAC